MIEDRDAHELLTRLGIYPACSVTLMTELRWTHGRFAEAVNRLRELGIKVKTTDRETICISLSSWKQADQRATAYLNGTNHATGAGCPRHDRR
jgi:hypothetical protein